MKTCKFCEVFIDFNIVTQHWENDEDDSIFRDICPAKGDGHHSPLEG